MGYCSSYLSFFLFPLIFLSFYFFVSSGVCVMGFLSSLLLSYSLSPMHKIAVHIHTHAHTIIDSRHILSNQFPVDKSKSAFYICKREREREGLCYFLTEGSSDIYILFLWCLSVSLQTSIKEGLLLKQTSSFQRWKKRYFKLRGRTLYYAKDAKVGLLSVSTHGAHAPVATGDELLIAFTATNDWETQSGIKDAMRLFIFLRNCR